MEQCCSGGALGNSFYCFWVILQKMFPASKCIFLPFVIVFLYNRTPNCRPLRTPSTIQDRLTFNRFFIREGFPFRHWPRLSAWVLTLSLDWFDYKIIIVLRKHIMLVCIFCYVIDLSPFFGLGRQFERRLHHECQTSRRSLFCRWNWNSESNHRVSDRSFFTERRRDLD